jgi:hypothetical protein
LMIFWWFPRFCLIFSFDAKPSKIIEKSSKNYHFFIIVFVIRLKIIIFLSLFLSFCLSSQDTSLHPTKFLCQQIILANVLKVTLPRFEQRKAAMYMDFGHMMPRHLESRI